MTQQFNFADEDICVLGSDGFIGQNFMSIYPDCFGVTGRAIRENNRLHETIENFGAVLNLTGYNGNIEFNKSSPFSILRVNTELNNKIFEALHYSHIWYSAHMFASCAYPSRAGKLYEWDWQGLPLEESVCGHGWAKRHLQSLCTTFTKQTGQTAVTFCPSTVAGVGEKIYEGKPKVLLSIVLKLLKARKEGAGNIILLGDGRPEREFVWVEDVCRFIRHAFGKYTDSTEPLNLPAAHNLSILNLATLARDTIYPECILEWEGSQGNGSMGKSLDWSKYMGVCGLPPNHRFTIMPEMIKRLGAHYEKLV
jgi:GDP-L-fucose synthase